MLNINSEFKKAISFFENNKLESAEEICLKIYNLDSKNFDNLRLLNFIYFKKKNFSKALDFINKAIEINPNFAEAYMEKGNALNGIKKFDSAIKNYEKAIKINPNYSHAYYNKGLVFHELKKIKDAEENYSKAIKINPNHIYAYNNRAFALQQLKKFDESLKNYNKVYQIDPNFNFLLGKIAHTKSLLCHWESLDKVLKILKNKLNNNEAASVPFDLLSLYDSPLLQKKTSEIFIEKTFGSKKNYEPFLNKIENKKIRIGYYSADFYSHAMTHLLVRLFELHDKSKFEIIAFSFGPEKKDEISKRIKNSFSQFLKVNSKTNKEISQLSKKLNIDIAVDLMCHTANNRIEIFSERCAPVQINYLGYPGTSGAKFIDYIIADKILIPTENQKYYSEKIIYLPNTYQVRDSKQKISNKIYTKKEMDLPEKGFVFCCFNQNYKINPNVYNIWMNLLKKTNDSVLWLIKDSELGAANLKKEAIKRGIEPNRIIFAKRMEISEHLARHKLADLFIDTFPYTSHTTCSDALWSGLPVIARQGQSFPSRVSASLLNAVGLKDLITKTDKEYESLILKIVKSPNILKEIKKKLKKNILTEPLFNTKLYTKNIETSYKKIHERNKLKLKPENIYIK